MQDRGVQCMFVGYSLKHDGNCFRMWDPVTRRVHVTRDVVWLRTMFFPRAPGHGPPEESVMPSIILPLANADAKAWETVPGDDAPAADPVGLLVGDEDGISIHNEDEAT